MPTEVGTLIFRMQTKEEGKALLFAIQTLYIPMEFGACDYTIHKLHKHNTDRSLRTIQQTKLIAFTFHLTCSEVFLCQLSSNLTSLGFDQIPPKWQWSYWIQLD